MLFTAQARKNGFSTLIFKLAMIILNKQAAEYIPTLYCNLLYKEELPNALHFQTNISHEAHSTDSYFKKFLNTIFQSTSSSAQSLLLGQTHGLNTG